MFVQNNLQLFETNKKLNMHVPWKLRCKHNKTHHYYDGLFSNKIRNIVYHLTYQAGTDSGPRGICVCQDKDLRTYLWWQQCCSSDNGYT